MYRSPGLDNFEVNVFSGTKKVAEISHEDFPNLILIFHPTIIMEGGWNMIVITLAIDHNVEEFSIGISLLEPSETRMLLLV